MSVFSANWSAQVDYCHSLQLIKGNVIEAYFLVMLQSTTDVPSSMKTQDPHSFHSVTLPFLGVLSWSLYIQPLQNGRE